MSEDDDLADGGKTAGGTNVNVERDEIKGIREMNENLPGLGDNIQTPSYFEDESARLKIDYRYLVANVEELEAKADKIKIVDDQATKDVVTALIKNMREQWKRLQGVHETEKAPNLERGRAEDGFFFGLMDRLGRRDKKAKPGAADRLNALLTDYDVRELAKEQERRRKEAEAAAELARKAEEARLEAEREAEEARLAAERARKPETMAAKEERAGEAAEAAGQARVEEAAAAAKAEEAHVATLATPAQIMRHRSDAGVTSSMAREKFAEIVDRNVLDLERLRPYIPMPALESALNRYASSVGHSEDASVQIKGARFGTRPKSRVY